MPARRRLSSFCLAAVAIVVLSALAPQPARAQFYTWTDEKGVVHMTDRKDKVPAGKVTEVPSTPAVAVEGGRRGVVKAMLENAQRHPRLHELRTIAAEYHRSHTYSMADYFVCVDMALDMANILKTRNFKPSVVAGTVKTDVSSLSPEKMMTVFDHAWVVVELGPGVYAAIETTGGFVADEKAPNFENYYQGLVFKTPRQAKETDVLIRTVNQDCAKAGELIKEFNVRYAGRQATLEAIEAKGRLEAKIAECKGAQAKYAALLQDQFRKLY